MSTHACFGRVGVYTVDHLVDSHTIHTYMCINTHSIYVFLHIHIWKYVCVCLYINVYYTAHLPVYGHKQKARFGKMCSCRRSCASTVRRSSEVPASQRNRGQVRSGPKQRIVGIRTVSAQPILYLTNGITQKKQPKMEIWPKKGQYYIKKMDLSKRSRLKGPRAQPQRSRHL